MDDQITIHVRLDRSLHEKISKEAKDLGLTVSAYVRMLLTKEVK